MMERFLHAAALPLSCVPAETGARMLWHSAQELCERLPGRWDTMYGHDGLHVEVQPLDVVVKVSGVTAPRKIGRRVRRRGVGRKERLALLVGGIRVRRNEPLLGG